MKILVAMFMIFPFSLFAQESWEKVEASVFMDVIRNYEKSIAENESYSLETVYKVYADFTDETYQQAFEAKLICRNGIELNSFQMGQIMVQDKNLNVTIDTANNQLIVQNPDLSFYYRKKVEDYTVLAEMAENVYRKSVNGKMKYRLELKKGYSYEAIEFLFLENNGISQVVLFSDRPYYTEGDNYSDDKAKIILDFNNFRKGKAADLEKFITIKDCVSISENQIIPIGKYKDFELIDLRN